MAKSLTYQEGTWFAVPLRTGGYGVGIVVRQSGDGIVFGYFFGPKREVIPNIGEVETLRQDKALLRLQCGDLGLINGEWPIIGRSHNYDRSDWPLMPFIRVDDESGEAWKDVYSDELVFMHEDPCDPKLSEQYPESVLAGYGSLEKRLTRLINK